jgi:hypothetical protein
MDSDVVDTKPKKTFKQFISDLLDFFKTTDFELSIKNDDGKKSIKKESSNIDVGIEHKEIKTNIQYSGNKIKVSHENVSQEKTSLEDDLKDL